jgi:5-methylcytosine-specific restriction endonuclease McrA
MTHNPYSVEPRKPLTTKQRAQLFIEHDGICCICHNKILKNDPWIDEHRVPLWLDGTNDWSNRAPAHVECARQKTAREAKTRAKGRRIAEKHMGAKRSKRPMPGGRNSKWKKTFSNGWVRRDGSD